MKLTLHHVNLCSTNVPAMDEFCRSVLGMAWEPSLRAMRDTSQGYAGAVAFVTDGTTQLRLAERDLDVGFRTGQPLNPLERGTSRSGPTTSRRSAGTSRPAASLMPTTAAGPCAAGSTSSSTTRKAT